MLVLSGKGTQRDRRSHYLGPPESATPLFVICHGISNIMMCRYPLVLIFLSCALPGTHSTHKIRWWATPTIPPLMRWRTARRPEMADLYFITAQCAHAAALHP